MDNAVLSDFGKVEGLGNLGGGALRLPTFPTCKFT
jgi:hypothetical protein